MAYVQRGRALLPDWFQENRSRPSSGTPSGGGNPLGPTDPAAPGTPSPGSSPTPLQAGTGEPGALRAFFMANRESGKEQAQMLGGGISGRLSDAEQRLPGLTQESPAVPQGGVPPALDPGIAKQRDDLLSPLRDDINLLGRGPEGQATLLAKNAGPGYTPTMGALDAWLLSAGGLDPAAYQERMAKLDAMSPYRTTPVVPPGRVIPPRTPPDRGRTGGPTPDRGKDPGYGRERGKDTGPRRSR